MARWTLTLGSLLLPSVCFLGLAASAGGGLARTQDIWHSREVGLEIRYPAGWHVTTRSLTTITQPVQRFVVYSGALPQRTAQVASPRGDQALAILMEQTAISASDLKEFPPRPNKFAVSHPGGIESFDGDRWAERVFRENGRAFYVFIWVGAKDDRQLPTLLNALDSLRVT